MESQVTAGQLILIFSSQLEAGAARSNSDLCNWESPLLRALPSQARPAAPQEPILAPFETRLIREHVLGLSCWGLCWPP